MSVSVLPPPTETPELEGLDALIKQVVHPRFRILVKEALETFESPDETTVEILNDYAEEVMEHIAVDMRDRRRVFQFLVQAHHDPAGSAEEVVPTNWTGLDKPVYKGRCGKIRIVYDKIGDRLKVYGAGYRADIWKDLFGKKTNER